MDWDQKGICRRSSVFHGFIYLFDQLNEKREAYGSYLIGRDSGLVYIPLHNALGTYNTTNFTV